MTPQQFREIWREINRLSKADPVAWCESLVKTIAEATKDKKDDKK